MNKAAVSIMTWGLYEAGTGLGFLLIPNILLPIFGFPTTTEVWIRVLGLVVLALALYHIHCARNNVIPFFSDNNPWPHGVRYRLGRAGLDGLLGCRARHLCCH